MAREKRFVVIHKESTALTEETRILVDTRTGVNYLAWQRGYAGGITPLLDREGKPVISSAAEYREG